MLLPFRPTPWVRHWGDDAWSWNVTGLDDDDVEVDGSGMPGRGLVAGAVLFWMDRNPWASATDVSVVFNIGVPFAEDVMRPDLFGSSDLSEAIQVWSILIGVEVPIDLAASVFARPPVEIIAAIGDHHWMYVERRGGVLCIGHEGE